MGIPAEQSPALNVENTFTAKQTFDEATPVTDASIKVIRHDVDPSSPEEGDIIITSDSHPTEDAGKIRQYSGGSWVNIGGGGGGTVVLDAEQTFTKEQTFSPDDANPAVTANGGDNAAGPAFSGIVATGGDATAGDNDGGIGVQGIGGLPSGGGVSGIGIYGVASGANPAIKGENFNGPAGLFLAGGGNTSIEVIGGDATIDGNSGGDGANIFGGGGLGTGSGGQGMEVSGGDSGEGATGDGGTGGVFMGGNSAATAGTGGDGILAYGGESNGGNGGVGLDVEGGEANSGNALGGIGARITGGTSAGDGPGAPGAIITAGNGGSNGLGGAGLIAQGGDAGGGDNNGGVGLIASGGAGNGTGVSGHGVIGIVDGEVLPPGLNTPIGVVGVGPTTYAGYGVYGTASGAGVCGTGVGAGSVGGLFKGTPTLSSSFVLNEHGVYGIAGPGTGLSPSVGVVGEATGKGPLGAAIGVLGIYELGADDSEATGIVGVGGTLGGTGGSFIGGGFPGAASNGGIGVDGLGGENSSAAGGIGVRGEGGPGDSGQNGGSGIEGYGGAGEGAGYGGLGGYFEGGGPNSPGLMGVSADKDPDLTEFREENIGVVGGGGTGVLGIGTELAGVEGIGADGDSGPGSCGVGGIGGGGDIDFDGGPGGWFNGGQAGASEGVTTGGQGVVGTGGDAVGGGAAGVGVVGYGGTGSVDGGVGVSGQGGTPNSGNHAGGIGGEFHGGAGLGTDQNGGYGVYVVGGTPTGTGGKGVGVYSVSAGGPYVEEVAYAGLAGFGTKYGVYAIASGSSAFGGYFKAYGVGSIGVEGISTSAAGIKGSSNTGPGVEAVTELKLTGTNASYASIKTISEEVTIGVGSGSGGVATSGNLAPAGALIFGVAARITDAPGGGATTVDIGITGAGNPNALIDVMATALDTIKVSAGGNDGTQLPLMNGSATTLTLTTDGDVTGNEMKVRVVVYYLQIVAPTS